jgi:hypothetical protein
LLTFDNRTRYYIHSYVNREYVGTLGPLGDLYGPVDGGRTQLYARAVFDNGEVLTWGPVVVDCPARGSYAWRLYSG